MSAMLKLDYLRNDGALISLSPSGKDAPAALDKARQEAKFFWLDIDRPDDSESLLLGDYFHFHKLEIEDALEDRHHPKLEEFDDHLFLIVHGVVHGLSLEDFRTRELDIFMSDWYLVTHHREESLSIAQTQAACEDMEVYLERGPAYLCYQILDRQMELYNPVMDAFGEAIAELEDTIFNNPSPEILPKLFGLKRSVLELRRVATHQRDIFARLARHATPPITPETAFYYRDIYDHLVRIVDHAENDRDTLVGAMEAYLSQISNQLNQVMKVLAVFSTIAIPMTVVTSFYGMNFDVLPVLHYRWGYLIALAVMLAISLAMLYYFRLRRWI